MTFSEWVTEISREMGMKADKDLIADVLVMAIRVAYEEFGANPVDADLIIPSIGRFYMNHKRIYNKLGSKDGEDVERPARWTMHFKPSSHLKKVINNEIPLTDAMVGKRFLYPELHTDKINKSSYYQKTLDPHKNKDKEIRHTNEYWYKIIEKVQRGEMRYVNGELVISGIKGFKEKIEKRGRPHRYCSASEINRRVLGAMRRDLRREKRWLAQGKITEKDLTLAKW